MQEPLKNCPFCGEAAKHSFNSLYGDMSMASCKSCGATAYAPKWNRRAVLAKWGQPAQAAEPVAREQLTDEQIQDLLLCGNPTDEEMRLIRIGWDAARGIKGG